MSGDIVSPLQGVDTSSLPPVDLTTVASSNITDGSCFVGSEELGVDVIGLVAIIIFYMAVLGVGIWASWKTRKEEQNQEQVMLAGRDIGLFVGMLTMGATWVGGGFINGSAQETYSAGLIWTQAPFGYACSLFISGTFFARIMRDSEYVTMVDPFTQKYGKWGALQALPAAVSEIFWSASILGALGSTLQVILNIDEKISIIMSAVIALGYTLLGGLISVAYTDVIQIFFIVFGLFLALPFAITHEAVTNIYEEKLPGTETPAWYGSVDSHDWGLWTDYAFLLLFGGIPWQCYYQRVLSSRTGRRAQMLSYGGAVIALIMTGPSVLFGAIARNTDWSKAVGVDYPAPEGNCAKVVLPLALQYLTPKPVAFFGLGAVSAAVMSSTDSSMLSASTMIARNFYQVVFRPKASDKEIIWVLWGCIIVNCCIATSLAIVYRSIYDLFVLCGDFMFVIVFGQLALVLFFEKGNTYGSVSSFFISLLLRLLCGDPKMQLDRVISFGTIVTSSGEGDVPFRTIVCIIGIVTNLLVSLLTHHLFTEEKLDLSKDFFGCYKRGAHGEIVAARSRLMKHQQQEEYQMQIKNGDMKIPRPKVESGAYKNDGFN